MGCTFYLGSKSAATQLISKIIGSQGLVATNLFSFSTKCSLSIFPVQKHMSFFFFFFMVTWSYIPRTSKRQTGFQDVLGSEDCIWIAPPNKRGRTKFLVFFRKKDPDRKLTYIMGYYWYFCFCCPTSTRRCSNEASPCLGTTEQLFRDPHHPFA